MGCLVCEVLRSHHQIHVYFWRSFLRQKVWRLQVKDVDNEDMDIQIRDIRNRDMRDL